MRQRGEVSKGRSSEGAGGGEVKWRSSEAAKWRSSEAGQVEVK